MTGDRLGQSGSRGERAEETGRGSREKKGWEPVRPDDAPEAWPERRLAYG